MKKNRTGERLLLFFLTVAVVLTTQGFPVLAETVQPQSQFEVSKELPGIKVPEAPAAPETPETQGESTAPETSETQGESTAPEIPETSADSIIPEASEPNGSAVLQALSDSEAPADGALNLTDSVLKDHIVPGLNPEQAVVNLFDYWQIKDDRETEYIWDWEDEVTHVKHEICDMGISAEHLLRFGLTRTYEEDIWDYGKWNRYSAGKPYQGIVQNTLGDDGFPRLNFAGVDENEFGNYADSAFDHQDVLTSAKKVESLAYLFSVSEKNDFKEIHSDVQGLFQLGTDGYYRYDSKKNFAELDAEHSRFILYDSPGVGTMPDEASGSVANYGEFFPFNTAEDVFNRVYEETDEDHPYHLSYVGASAEGDDADYITREDGSSFLLCTDGVLNHYIGMTLEVPFLQPEQGRLPNNVPMRFEFSGDDDVWIFIDDVLVADLGGIHDAYELSIDFSTGVVDMPSLGVDRKHTLRESFEEAYPDSEIGGFDKETFADNTVHILKMFYLERGNIASNLSLSFNIQIARYNQIKKVDQNGDTMNKVSFELYPAEAYAADGEGRILCTSTLSGETCYVEQSDKDGEPLIKFTTGAGGADGIADFIDQASGSGYSFSRSSTNYYILRETKAPDGYRSQPVDIVLEYNPATAMLSVANRWQTGAYASFTSYVNEWAGKGINYGQYNSDTGFVESSSYPVSLSSRKEGLVLAVPMLQRGSKDDSVWIPLYGSNIDGFHTPGEVGNTADSMAQALLKAALYQCLYEEGWYLKWSDEKAALEGSLTDLPGRADRYRHVNPEGDMRMVYIIIEPQALKDVGINEGDSQARYKALKKYVEAMEDDIDTAVEALYGAPAADDRPDSRQVNMLDTTQFMRIFRSLIYISNDQRELRVLKVDKYGEGINGVQFGMYESREDAQNNVRAVATGVTAHVDDEDGILVFKPQPDGGAGYAKMVWADALSQTYYLKEISAPEDYLINETIVPVVIGAYSVYADAGAADDGVSVMAGVGKLCRTMAKYASDGEVDITLRDITAIAQTQESDLFDPDGWANRTSSGSDGTMDLHYDINSRMGMDYGLHDGVSGTPFFIAETGFLRANVVQNADALRSPDDGNGNLANWYDLGDTELTGLFSLLNVVVVEDRSTSDELRELRVLKTDEDGKALNGARFGLFNSVEDAQKNENAVATGTTANVNGQDGVLVFQAQTGGKAGFARIAWKDTTKPYYLYLKEISAPKGYRINETIIPVVVDAYSVYADAGTEEDGVSVMAGVGCLRRTETKYADDSGVEPTLQDITITAQGQASAGYDSGNWTDLPDASGQKQEKDLHYGINREMGMDYGLHDQVEDTTPFFTTETGFIRTGVTQNTEELRTGKYHDAVSETLWDDLDGQDLTEWFSQLNIVVVKDQKGRDPKNPNGDPDDDPDDDPEKSPADDGDADSDTGGDSVFSMLQSYIGTPQTGDDSLMWWWALLGGVSLLGIGATVCNLILRKRRQKKQMSEEKQEKDLPEEKPKKDLSKRKRKKHSPRK